MKKEINPISCAGTVMNALKDGVLLVAAADGRVNPMTISWGYLGIEWGKPVFITVVRDSRFTKKLLDKNPEFTISVPVDGGAKKILALCGSKSGRDTDKIAELGLTTVEPDEMSVPGIKELPLTLECRVRYQKKQEIADLPADIAAGCYSDGDAHTAFYGEIVKAYIIE